MRSGILTFRDPVAGVTSTDPSCTVLSPYKVSCNPEAGPDGIFMSVDLGDGDDIGTLQDDFGFFSQSMTGGPGTDVLNGSSGNDSFGDNDDLDADTYNGGEGFDYVAYSSSAAAVNVSLNDVADDGRTGEGDNVHADVEGIFGSPSGDVLTGDDDQNHIVGFNGPDIISGLGGDDQLEGGEGVDTIDGGEGNDLCSLGPSNDGTTVNCP